MLCVVDGQASAVLVDFRLELHLRGHRGVHARQLASEQARAVQRGKRFLAADAQPARAFRQRSRTCSASAAASNTSCPIAPPSKSSKPGNLRHRRIRQIRLLDLRVFARLEPSAMRSQPSGVHCHLLDGGFTAKRATQFPAQTDGWSGAPDRSRRSAGPRTSRAPDFCSTESGLK